MKIAALFVFLCLFAGGATTLFAQLEEIQTKQPNVVSGQLFTMRIIPGSGKFQIYVVGNKVTDFAIQDVKLKASMKAKGQFLNLTSNRENDHFLITLPANSSTGSLKDFPADSQINLKVDYKDKSEKFNLKLNTKK
jgi:hypothetical protein